MAEPWSRNNAPEQPIKFQMAKEKMPFNLWRSNHCREAMLHSSKNNQSPKDLRELDKNEDDDHADGVKQESVAWNVTKKPCEGEVRMD